MEIKKLAFDEENKEFIVNGNRMSKESLLNLLAVGLFINLHFLAVRSGEFDPAGIFSVVLSPQDFEKWLYVSEVDSAALVFSYLPEGDRYLITVSSAPKKEKYSDENNTNEIKPTSDSE